MKRSKNRSEVSLTIEKSVIQSKEEVYAPPLDVFTVKVTDLRIPDGESKPYAIKVTFFDQLLVSSVIASTEGRENIKSTKKAIARGYMNYDPSDYEKMCLFADNPLIIRIHPFKCVESDILGSDKMASQSQSNKSDSYYKPLYSADIYCCNIDILPLFIDTNKMVFIKRMQPMILPSVLKAKSWDNLPEITLSVKALRNILNAEHHKIFKEANYMKMTLIGCYNMIMPFDDTFVYTAASKLPITNETNTALVTFDHGFRIPKKFNQSSFHPHWESLRLSDDPFTEDDKKYEFNVTGLQNEENIDLDYYLHIVPKYYTTLWTSFHRHLLLKNTEQWLTKQLRNFKWPLEVHMYGESSGHSFMAFLDLFEILYPGEKTARLVVPLQWLDTEAMLATCGCEPLLTPNEKVSSAATTAAKPSKVTTESAPASMNTEITFQPRNTGSDEKCAFVIVEVTLGRPLRKPVVPRHISESEVNSMLEDMEVRASKRECSGRGQLARDWKATVRSAATSLRRVPYFGAADICNISRQLSCTRTRVELVTSFWQEAAIYANNNFVTQEFLHSDETFKEMLMITHACLMRITNETLLATGKKQPYCTLSAARHARQMQDLSHAVELYLELVVESSREADSWRELATCLRDVDRDWATACINKSILLNPRHPLSLLSKASMIFEENVDAAEPFFLAMLVYYPFWRPLWIAANAYYFHREHFHMAEQIMALVKKTEAEALVEEMRFPRAWERELGDWWDNTPLLPGTSLYYDTADLLLRLRAISLAEICIARALLESGESAVYYHMVALCCRLRGQYDEALCHLQLGIEKYGDISYLRSLEGECFHKKKELQSSMVSFEKAGSSGSPYITLLSLPRRRESQKTRSILTDLVRRHPSAYGWMAFADEWIMRSATGEGGDADATAEQRAAAKSASTCALLALKYDRRAARAWALLARLLAPSARRQYCKEMAELCGYGKEIEDRPKRKSDSQESFCYRIGKVLRECRCEMCEHLVF